MAPLPVLLYHSVQDDPPTWLAPYTVTPRVFSDQLDTLLDSGRTPVTAAQVAAARRGGPPLPEQAVAVTFDDGYRDFLDHALPGLDARQIPATLFVTTGALAPNGRSLLPSAAMLTLAEVCMLDTIGIAIGAHTHAHPQLDTVAAATAAWELTHSKEILEQALGHEITLSAYPHGYSSRHVRDLARQAGYHAAFAVRDALSSDDDNPYRLARLTVKADTSLDKFGAWLAGGGAPIAAPREHAITLAWRCYRRARVRLPRPSAAGR